MITTATTNSWVAPAQNFGQLNGYLRKKSKNQHWQKRWFEANDHYLTYYKDQNSEKLLACIDLRLVAEIDIGDGTSNPDIGCFYIKLAGRTYVMKAKNDEMAQQWVDGLRARQGGYKSYESNKAVVLSSLEDLSQKKEEKLNKEGFTFKANESLSTSSSSSISTSSRNSVSKSNKSLFGLLLCTCCYGSQMPSNEVEMKDQHKTNNDQLQKQHSSSLSSNPAVKKAEDNISIISSSPIKAKSSDIVVTQPEAIKIV